MASNKQKALGQGLSALFGEIPDEEANEIKPLGSLSEQGNGSARYTALDRLVTGTFQPRKTFDKDALRSLADSILSQGIIQPILVRPLSPDDPRRQDGARFEILAGERRWRAAKIAQLNEVPILLRELSDAGAIEIGLVENIQRQDLDAIEEALALRQLMDQFGYTQEAIARAVGRSRSAVANSLRLLSLPDPVKDLARSGQLTGGHLRVLVGLPDTMAEAWAKEAVSQALSVRAFEKLVRKRKQQAEPQNSFEDSYQGPLRAQGKEAFNHDPDIQRLEEELSSLLGVEAKIRHRGARGGSLTLHYQHFEQLDQLLVLLMAKR